MESEILWEMENTSDMPPYSSKMFGLFAGALAGLKSYAALWLGPMYTVSVHAKTRRIALHDFFG